MFYARRSLFVVFRHLPIIKDLNAVALVSREWDWTRWQESDRRALVVPFIYKVLKTRGYRSEFQCLALAHLDSVRELGCNSLTDAKALIIRIDELADKFKHEKAVALFIARTFPPAQYWQDVIYVCKYYQGDNIR
jgi:hypothetical protein